MALSYLTLFVALCLSSVAAFYSIVGLTAIFAAAVIPIVIMGTALEVAKLVVTLWLHEYWKDCKRTMKAYLVPAVGALMVITSMGIFGFLSKAHLDQGVPTGDIAAKVALYDEKINTQRENIKAARANLSQLDAAVNETMGRSTNEQGADKAIAIRRAQAKDRAKLTKEIEVAQDTITKLQEEKAPIAAEYRKVEAEVGPVKYIAALIYDDAADQNVLEKAVRWVIILLVAVFDPLAVMMLLAATESLKWEREKKTPHTVWEEIKGVTDDFFPGDNREPEDDEAARAQEANLAVAEVEKEPETEVFVETEPDNEAELAAEANMLAAEVEKEPETVAFVEAVDITPELQSRISDLEKDNAELQESVNLLVTEVQNKMAELERVQAEQQVKLDIQALPKQIEINQTVVEPEPEPEPEVVAEPEPEPEVAEPTKLQPDPALQAVLDEKEARRFWKYLNPEDSVERQLSLYESGQVTTLPWNTLKFRDMFEALMKTNFLGYGVKFPEHPDKGDTFIRSDSMPTTLYKWNGSQWIVVDKETTDVYAYDDNYIKYLVEKINKGEYDTDLLSDVERDHIETYMLNNK